MDNGDDGASEDEPISSSEAPATPALGSEEGLSTPVAPDVGLKGVSGPATPGLSPSGEHVAVPHPCVKSTTSPTYT